MTSYRSRPGVTLLELLLFLGLLSLTAGALIFFFLSAGENQLRQRAISDVDGNGQQLLQALAYRIRHAERVVDPPAGSSGTILLLQVGSIDSDPIVIGAQSGAVIMEQGEEEYLLNDMTVTVTDFRVVNTSPQASRPSVTVSFVVTREMRYNPPLTFSRRFEQAVTLFPADEPAGNPCGCAGPSCVAGVYNWGVCLDESTCLRSSGALLCT